MSEISSSEFAEGARFVKAALQVNPFAYLQRHGKKTPFTDEDSYNEALIQSCLDKDIRVIAVTDHFSIDDSLKLIKCARGSDLAAFPGFEAVTAEGIHALCIFDLGTTKRKIERCIGACGVQDPTDETRPAKVSFSDLLRLAGHWGAVVIAAHVASGGGLLATLDGIPRQEAWTDDRLIAAALSIPKSKLGRGKRQMIRGTQKGYERDHPVAIIYAADVSDPSKLGDESSWTWLKMSAINVEGLRHSFLDPESRVRLPEEYQESSGRRIVSVSWTGGFLDGVKIPLNQALNVLIGPRGSGKSTLLESIRFVLGSEILGDEAKEAHDGFVSEVLRPGTEVELEVGSDAHEGIWKIRRAVSGGDAVVLGPDESSTKLVPVDLVGCVEVFGQHEVAELARMPARRSRLLDRFVPTSPPPPKSRGRLSTELAENRASLLDLQQDRSSLDEELERLPVVEARLEKYRKAGAKTKLEREAGYRREKPLLDQVDELVDNLEADWDEIEQVDLGFLADEVINELPSKVDLTTIRRALKKLNGSIAASLKGVGEAVALARAEVEGAAGKRDLRRAKERDSYLARLRKLQTERIDGEDYLALEQELAELAREEKKLESLLKKATGLEGTRKKVLDEWYALQEREHDRLKTAAKLVSQALSPTVRVVTRLRGDRSGLVDFLRSQVAGQLHNVDKAVRSREEMSPREFTEACRQGPDGLKEYLGVGGKQVEKITALDAAALMKMEEIWLESTTSIELNVGETVEGRPIWRSLEHLSTGQKATAILLVLLLDSTASAPLIVDQLEDDLDNAFIADDVVPRLRADKHSRQFLLSTHNPNIPVLGDAEQVIRLTAVGEAGAGGRAFVDEGHLGSLDQATIRVVLEELEGGRRAFETRRRRYGY